MARSPKSATNSGGSLPENCSHAFGKDGSDAFDLVALGIDEDGDRRDRVEPVAGDLDRVRPLDAPRRRSKNHAERVGSGVDRQQRRRSRPYSRRT